MAHNESLLHWIGAKITYIVLGSLAVVASMLLYAIVDDPLKAMVGSGEFMAIFAIYIVCLIFGLNRLHAWIAG